MFQPGGEVGLCAAAACTGIEGFFFAQPDCNATRLEQRGGVKLHHRVFAPDASMPETVFVPQSHDASEAEIVTATRQSARLDLQFCIRDLGRLVFEFCSGKCRHHTSNSKIRLRLQQTIHWYSQDAQLYCLCSRSIS